MANQNRQAWPLRRFVQTLTYFERLPFLNWIPTMRSAVPPPSPKLQADLIFDFRTATAPLSQTWGSLDDIVMGGASASQLQQQEQAALFTGMVTTANSGGFVSVRTRNFVPPLDLSLYSGVELWLKGDGQRYKFLIRDRPTWDSLAFAYSFDTPHQDWTRIRVPFAETVPVFRAKTVADAPTLNTNQICALQLMLSKFEYDGQLNPHFHPGPFALAIQTIGVY